MWFWFWFWFWLFAVMTQTFSCVWERDSAVCQTTQPTLVKSSCPIGCGCDDMGQPIRRPLLRGSVHLPVSERLSEPPRLHKASKQGRSSSRSSSCSSSSHGVGGGHVTSVGVANSGHHPRCNICTRQHRCTRMLLCLLCAVGAEVIVLGHAPHPHPVAADWSMCLFLTLRFVH